MYIEVVDSLLNMNGKELERSFKLDSNDNVVDTFRNYIDLFNEDNALVLFNKDTLDRLVSKSIKHIKEKHKGVIYFEKKDQYIEYRYDSKSSIYILSSAKFGYREYRGTCFEDDYCIINIESNKLNQRIR